jgi:anti-sigma B factor antagonist
MSILHRTLNADVHLLKINRPLSGRWANELEQKFKDALDRGARRVVVDLEEVPLVDSRGLAALVKGYKIFGSNGQNFQLAALQEQPRLLLELTMFDRIFQVFDSVAEATESIPHHSIQFVQEARTFAPQLVVR